MRWGWSRFLTEIGVDAAAVAAGVQCSEHVASVGPYPDSNIEWNALWRSFGRSGAADLWGRLPLRDEFLCREALYALMSGDAGKRRRKAEAVVQHVLGACLAEVFAEVFVAIENLTKDSL